MSLNQETICDSLKKLSHKDCVRFALFCAKQFPQDDVEAISCIEVVERWLEGKATSEECRIAYAAYVTAAYASATAYVTAYVTAAAALKEEQMRYLKELLEFDEIAEKSLLYATTQ